MVDALVLIQNELWRGALTDAPHCGSRQGSLRVLLVFRGAAQEPGLLVAFIRGLDGAGMIRFGQVLETTGQVAGLLGTLLARELEVRVETGEFGLGEWPGWSLGAVGACSVEKGPPETGTNS